MCPTETVGRLNRDSANLVPRILSYPSVRSDTVRREILETRLRQRNAKSTAKRELDSAFILAKSAKGP